MPKAWARAGANKVLPLIFFDRSGCNNILLFAERVPGAGEYLCPSFFLLG